MKNRFQSKRFWILFYHQKDIRNVEKVLIHRKKTVL